MSRENFASSPSGYRSSGERDEAIWESRDLLSRRRAPRLTDLTPGRFLKEHPDRSRAPTVRSKSSHQVEELAALPDAAPSAAPGPRGRWRTGRVLQAHPGPCSLRRGASGSGRWASAALNTGCSGRAGDQAAGGGIAARAARALQPLLLLVLHLLGTRPASRDVLAVVSAMSSHHLPTAPARDPSSPRTPACLNRPRAGG